MKTKQLLVAILLASSRGLFAQSAGYGGIGDPAVAPGNPRTSYALSGIDHVNYYSGSVNFTIPLTTIGGRGTVSSRFTIPIQRQWAVTSVEGVYTPFSQFSNYM